MQIKWHGHSCFEISNNEVSILIDPHDGKSIGIKPPTSQANIVLITHNHYDHNASRIVKGEKKVASCMEGVESIDGVEVSGYISYHDEEGGQLRGSNIIYKFTLDGISVCHCGDLGDLPPNEVMESIRGVDIIFVPIGEVMTIPLRKLHSFFDAVEPKIIVPMHYRVGGLTLPLGTLDEFLKDVPSESVIYVGNEVELVDEELSDFMGVWVFDR